MKKRTLLISIFISCIFTTTISFSAQAKQIISKPATSMQDVTSPEEALQLLKDGNQRFVNQLQNKRNLLQIAKYTSHAQYPFAVILSCMDSRTAPEVLFDQGIGDVFSIRIAGNVLNNDELASMEYATKVVGAELIVVMGHTNCGAIQGACNDVDLGHLTSLLSKIKPAIITTSKNMHQQDCANAKFIDAATKQNVLDVMHDIPQESPVIASLIKEHKVMIVGAMQNLKTGQVTFFDGNNP